MFQCIVTLIIINCIGIITVTSSRIFVFTIFKVFSIFTVLSSNYCFRREQTCSFTQHSLPTSVNFASLSGFKKSLLWVDLTQFLKCTWFFISIARTVHRNYLVV